MWYKPGLCRYGNRVRALENPKRLSFLEGRRILAWPADGTPAEFAETSPEQVECQAFQCFSWLIDSILACSSPVAPANFITPLMVGGKICCTINWEGTADLLLEQDPPVVYRLFNPVEKYVIDELMDKLVDFRSGYLEDVLEVEEFGPVNLFRSMFLGSWKKSFRDHPKPADELIITGASRKRKE